MSARSEIAAEVSETGTVLVSGRLLAEISRALPAKPVEMVLDGTKVSVTCGASRFTLLTMPVEDYPALPAMPDVIGTVAGDQLAEAVAQVPVAARRDDTLPLLTGVRMEIEGDTMALLATDRYRLALRELRWTPARTDSTASPRGSGWRSSGRTGSRRPRPSRPGGASCATSTTCSSTSCSALPR